MKYGIIASTTRGSIGVAAAKSRYTLPVGCSGFAEGMCITNPLGFSRSCGLTDVRRCVLAVYVLRTCGLADVLRATLGGYDLSAESGGVKVMFWKRVDTKLSS